MEVQFEKGDDLSGEKAVDINGEKGDDILGVKGDDLSGEKAVDINGEKGVEISDEKAVDINGEKGDDILGVKGDDLSGEKAVDINGEKGDDISGVKGDDLSGEKAVDINGEKGVEISDKKAVDINGVKGDDISGEKAVYINGEKDDDISSEKGVKNSDEIGVDISGAKAVDINGEKDDDISGEKGVKNSDEKGIDISGEKAVDINGEKDDDISGKKGVQNSDEKGVDISGEKAVDINGGKGDDISGEKAVDIISKKGEDFNGEKGLQISDEKGVDISGEKAVDITGEKGVKNSDEKGVDISDEKDGDISGFKSEMDKDLSLTGNFLKYVYNIKQKRQTSKNKSPGEAELDPKGKTKDKDIEDWRLSIILEIVDNIATTQMRKQNGGNSQDAHPDGLENTNKSPCANNQETTVSENVQLDEINKEDVKQSQMDMTEASKEDITEEEKGSGDSNEGVEKTSNHVIPANNVGTSSDFDQESGVGIFPATVQVICVSEEPNGNQAFSVCDGTGYSKSDAFLNVGTHVELYSIIRIVLVEYEVGDAKRSKRRRRSKAGDLLGEDSKFERLLGIATFEIIENGPDIGHSLFCLQPPLISNFEKDNYEDQVVNGMGDFINEDLTLEVARVKFVFSDQTELFADKNTLIRQSNVFETHFSVPDSFLDQNVVQIVDAKPETFKKLLEFMEQKPFQVGRLQSIFDLLYIAEKYLVESLQTICRNAILEHLEHIPSSAVEILSLNKTSDVILCSSVFKSIEENIHLLLQSAQFLLWDFDTLKTVICLKNLNIDEWRLLQYVYKWSMDNFGEIKSGNDSEKCFHILLDCIKLEEITKENLNSFLKFKDLDKLLDLEKIEITIALIHLRKSQPLLAPASSFRDRNYHYNAKKSPRMFPVTVFSFDVELDETIQLPIVVTGDDQTMIQVDVNLKKMKSIQGEEEETDKMELLTKVVVVGSVRGLPDTSTFRVDDYSCHPSDFTADFSLNFVQFEHGKPAWCSVKTPYRKKWVVTLDRSLMRSDAGREVFSADLVIGSYRRNYEDDVNDVSKNEEDMYSDFSSFVPSDPESGTSLANHSANSDIFKTDSEDSHSSPRPLSIIHSDPDSDVELPKAKRRRIAQPSEDGSSSESIESHYITDPELGQSPGHDGNESPNQEEEEDDNSFIDDGDETIESPRAASTSSRVEAEDDSDNDSDVELPKAKRRRIANRLKSDSSSESQYSTDPELGDSPKHDDGNDINEEALEPGLTIPDSPDQGDNSRDEFSDGNPGDLCFSPEDCSDGPVFSADEEDNMDYQNEEEAQFSP